MLFTTAAEISRYLHHSSASLLTDLNCPQIIIIGALAVGKTSILMRYIYDQFQERVSTLIAEKDKLVTVDGQELHLKIWDTAGTDTMSHLIV